MPPETSAPANHEHQRSEYPGVFAHPARVTRQILLTGMLDPARVADRLAFTEMLDLIKTTRAIDPSIFDDHEPYFWSAEISSNRLDAYYTRMAPSSLKNYAADAQAGVAFQNSHNTRILPFGRSLTGKYVGAQGDGVAHVEADFYTLRGLNLSGVSTDELIAGMRSGIVSDVSIGFYGGSFRCSICGGDMDNWMACAHYPGVEYEKTDEKGRGTGEHETAFAWVEDARLAEVSAVFDGATPGAGILKAQRAIEAGALTAKDVTLLESRYRIRLPAVRTLSAPANRSQETAMPEQDINLTVETPPPAETREQPATEPTLLRSEHDAALAAERQTITRAMGLAETTPWSDTLSAIATLRAEATDGRTYRTDLVTAALAEGVRAHGTTFDQATYRTLLEAAPLETIKRLRADWVSVADKLFQGGRQTSDTHEPSASNGVARGVPADAFRS